MKNPLYSLGHVVTNALRSGAPKVASGIRSGINEAAAHPIRTGLTGGATAVAAGVMNKPLGTKTYKPLTGSGEGYQDAFMRQKPQQTTSLSGTPTSTPVVQTTATTDPATQYLKDENAASLAMGSKNLVQAMRGTQTTSPTTTDTTMSAAIMPKSPMQATTAPTSVNSPSVLDALRKKVSGLSAPSASEAALNDELAQFRGDARTGISNIEGQGRGIPLSLVRGEQAKLGEQAGIREQTLLDRITAASAQRQAQLQAAQQDYTMSAAEQARQDQLSQYNQTRQDRLTSPTEVGNSILQFDPATGTYKTLYTAPQETATPEGFSLSPGQTRYDANGNVIASSAESAAGGGDAYTLSPGQVRFDSSGNQIATGGAATPTEGQYKAYGFATRMDQSSKIIDNLDQNFTGTFGQGFKHTPEAFKSDDRKSIEQAEADFVNALLRRESGAAISPTEFSTAQKQYFPQAGDSQAILDQKKANRDTAMRAIQLEAQNVYNQQGQTIGGQSDPRESQLRNSGFSDQEISEYLGKANAGRAVSGSIVSVPLGNKQIQVSDKIASPLAMADAEYFRATGKHIEVSEGLRSHERQAELYQKYKSGQGGRAAPPGQSFHETGNAIDVSGDWKAAEPYLRKYGFKNPLADDKHHFSISEFA